MAPGAAKNKTLVQKRFLSQKDVSQPLTVADGALELDYASVIFVDPGVKVDES